MPYNQAVSEDRLDEYGMYRESFSCLYDAFREKVILSARYMLSEVPPAIQFTHTNTFKDVVDTFCISNNKIAFLATVEENSKEIYPFRNIFFHGHNVCLRFNFDWTFILIYEESSKIDLPLLTN